MSIFSSIGGFFKKLWNKIAKLLKTVLKFIKKYLPFIIIALVLLAPYLAPLIAPMLPAFLGSAVTAAGTFVAGLTATQAFALAVGTALIIDPEGTSELATKIVKSTGKVFQAAAEVIGATFGSFFSSLGIWPYIAGGVGIYMLLGDSSQSSGDNTNRVRFESDQQIANRLDKLPNAIKVI